MIENNNKKEKLPKFLYSLKLRSAIIAFVFFLLLSSEYAYQFLDMIFNNSLVLLNEKKEPSFLGKIIMGIILAIIIFIF
jgi:hypothetical protein